MADIKSITCEDKGDTYSLVIYLNDETIPTSVSDYTQTITGRAMAVNHGDEIQKGLGDAGTLTDWTQDYYNCSIKAVINKSTGKMQSCYHEMFFTMHMSGKILFLNPNDLQVRLQITENYEVYY